jgi:hypothetical protein
MTGSEDTSRRTPAVGGPGVGPAPGERLWLDRPGAARRIRRAPRRLRPALRGLSDSGIAILRQCVPTELCDRVISDLGDYIAAHGELVEAHTDEGGHFRVNNFHLGSEASLAVCLHEPILELLDYGFGYPAVPYSSLTFVRGTEQMTHRDGPYFATWPEGFFFGVWTALEDIHPDSGPLHYYPRGHRVDAARTDNVLDYGISVKSSCEDAGIQRTVVPLLHKGDTVVWHPELPHGGTPILDTGRTRKSMVVHYKAGHAPLHGTDEFFGRVAYRDTESVEYGTRNGRWFVDHGYVSLDT